MICKECLPLLESYLDGEVHGQTATLLSKHLSTCSSCMMAYQQLCQEQELYLRYECDVEAAPSFWDEVLARSAVEKGKHAGAHSFALRGKLAFVFNAFNTPRFSPVLTAVLLLFAVALTIGVMKYLSSMHKSSDGAVVVKDSGAAVPSSLGVTRNVDEAPPHMEENKVSTHVGKASEDARQQQKGAVGENGLHSTRKAEPRRQSTTDELVHEAERKYMAAIALLSHDVARRRSPLAPDAIQQFNQTLSAIDRTIASTRRAVREHPSDPVAVQYMLTAYAKKVEVLREMVNQ